MPMMINPNALSEIADAILAGCRHSSLNVEEIERKILRTGWAGWLDIEDYLSGKDSRLSRICRDSLMSLVASLELPIRYVAPKPDHSEQRQFCHQAINSSDFAALCMFFERLGFDVETSELCRKLSAHYSPDEDFTDSMVRVLYYSKERRRMPPVKLLADENTRTREPKRKRVKLGSGYSATLYLGNDNAVKGIEVRAPNFVKKHEPQEVTCGACGLPYLKWDWESEKFHRRYHQEKLSCIDPVPIGKARLGHIKQGLVFVDGNSTEWKRKQIWLRAREFKRELQFDFIQWQRDAKDDPAAIGVLLVDDARKIVGACSFRPASEAQLKIWKLDWIWICPKERRKGHLSQRWSALNMRFGDFEISKPISPEMTAFLKKVPGASSHEPLLR